MSPARQRPNTARPAFPKAGAGRPETIVELFDRHGSQLYGLASMLLGDGEEAVDVVAWVMKAANRTANPSGLGRTELVEMVFSRCASRTSDCRRPRPIANNATSSTLREGSACNFRLAVLNPDERAALSLVRFGRRDLRWVAQVMSIEPAAAAQLLRSALHQLVP